MTALNEPEIKKRLDQRVEWVKAIYDGLLDSSGKLRVPTDLAYGIVAKALNSWYYTPNPICEPPPTAEQVMEEFELRYMRNEFDPRAFAKALAKISK